MDKQITISVLRDKLAQDADKKGEFLTWIERSVP